MNRLVFLHGVGGGHAAWERQLAFFERHGYACTAWDQPGYGTAPIVDPYDLAQVCGALGRLIDSLGPDPVTLVGHSMGGFIAQEAYARFPQKIRGLALCFTSAAFGGQSGDFAKQFIEARILPLDQGHSMDEIAAKLMPSMRGSRSDPSGLALARRTMASIPPATYRKAVALLTTFNRREQLASIDLPTLLVAGSDDKTAPASVMERMAQKIPRSQYVLLDGCGHLGPMDQPEPFNAALLAFLQRSLP